MSHSQTWDPRGDDPPSGSRPPGDVELVVFHFNPDLSGDVTIVVEFDYVGAHEVKELRVPGQAILDFVADRIREAGIEALESAERAEFVGGLGGTYHG